MLKKGIQWLRKPSVSLSVASLLGVGLAIGVFSVVTFGVVMDATNTEEFCTSCHEMQSGPFAMIQETSHFSNRSGVRPICSDCHVPREFFPKIWRKIQASREVWGHITGKIDTEEKYLSHVKEMKDREVARMRANDSQECRNCHDVSRMLMSEQSAKAQQFHSVIQTNGKTCIDCHQGITHMSSQVIEALEKE